MEKRIVTVIFVTLNVCFRFSEAKVGLRASQFKRFGTDISLNGHLIGAYTGVSLLQCSLYCSENTVCAAINFASISQKCELLSASSHEFPSDVEESIGYWHYHLIIPEPTTNFPTTKETTQIGTTAEDTVVQTTQSTTTKTVRQTTTMLGETTKMTTTTKPTTEPTSEPTIWLTTEQTTEQTTERTTEMTTEPTTEPTTPEQTTSGGCDQVTTVTDYCDKTFTSECEKVATPNYPGDAPNDFSCGFSVQAPDGQEAQLFFDYFNFEYHFFCNYDHLEANLVVSSKGQPRAGLVIVSDANPNRLRRPLKNIPGFVYDELPPSLQTFRSPKLCGSSAGTLVTKDGFIYIHVFTDEDVQSGGMSVRLVFSKICGKTFSKNGQEISSPFYPDTLPVGITEYVCQFTIAAPTGSTVRIEFSFLHMEAHDTCIFDRIEFYNEVDADTGEPLETVCGETVPTNPVYLNTDSVVVKVITDFGYVSNGFVFTYWFE